MFVDNGIATYFEARESAVAVKALQDDDEFYSLIDKINGAADRQFDLNNERFEEYASQDYYLYFDSELVFGGPGDGSSATFNSLNASFLPNT